MASQRQIRRVTKPLVFLLASLPLVALLARIAGVGPSLGPNPVEALQDELGGWGLRFLLLTLALTPLRHVMGKPWPLQFRRMFGLFAFMYSALHFVNYLWLDQRLAWTAIVEDIVERPFITIGLGALLLMVPLAVTSTAGWRRRLGRRWQTLHRLVYVSAVLACWHFWWQVKENYTEPAIYATILAGLLIFRLGRRMRANRPQRTTAG